jgi:hypothetical protein
VGSVAALFSKARAGGAVGPAGGSTGGYTTSKQSESGKRYTPVKIAPSLGTAAADWLSSVELGSTGQSEAATAATVAAAAEGESGAVARVVAGTKAGLVDTQVYAASKQAEEEGGGYTQGYTSGKQSGETTEGECSGGGEARLNSAHKRHSGIPPRSPAPFKRAKKTPPPAARGEP